MQTTLFFIRHAQSYQSTDKLHYEWPLSDHGQNQARKLTTVLLPLKMDFIYSSPFIRCRQTIAPYIEHTGISLQIHEDLRERHVTDTVVDNFLEIWNRSWADFNYAEPGCENSITAQNRFSKAIDEIISKHRGSKIGICTHGNVIGLFLNKIDSRNHIEQAETLRNPDVLKVVFQNGVFNWDNSFVSLELDEISTSHRSTPIEKF